MNPDSDTNLELPLRAAGPKVKPEEVDAMCTFLRGKGWLDAAGIQEATGIGDRKMRALAEHSDGRIISGQAGYRYLDRNVPIDEVDESAGWLESQAKRMLKRAAAIRRRYHRYARDEAPST